MRYIVVANGMYWRVFDGKVYMCDCGRMEESEETAHRIAAALNREPEPRGVEFVEFRWGHTGTKVVNPRHVETFEDRDGETVLHMASGLHYTVQGTPAEVLAKLRGEREGGDDGDT